MEYNNPPLLQVIDFLSKAERGLIPRPSKLQVERNFEKLEEAKDLLQSQGISKDRIGLDLIIDRLYARLTVLNMPSESKEPRAEGEEEELDMETQELLGNLPQSDRMWYLEQRAKGKSNEQIIEELLGTM